MSLLTVHQTDGNARAGTLHTGHGDVPTPAFMPVATQGSVKAVDPADLRPIGAKILL
ncbi:MAG: tRNA-guanine transglycosylase, partial [Chloroflexi bacterium]|nr:tRNA-guanine transglycosylase [Chloroflexota bacterium]